MAAKPVVFIRSLIFAVLFYGLTVFFVLAALLFLPFSHRFTKYVVRGWGRAHRISCRIVLGQKVRIIGSLPDEPMLYIFKHESMFETIDLICLFNDPVVAAKQELLDIPLWGKIAQHYGLIGIRRAEGASALRHLQRQANAARAAGRPICLFPEGTRVPHGKRPPLRSGFAALYKLLKLPVVPIAVDSGRVSPRHGLLKFPGTITYKVGEIIPPGLPREEAESRVHTAINALNAPGGDGLARPA